MHKKVLTAALLTFVLTISSTAAFGATSSSAADAIKSLRLEYQLAGQLAATTDESVISQYTSDSWSAYVDAWKAAKKVLDKANATADDVKAAEAALSAAYNGLEPSNRDKPLPPAEPDPTSDFGFDKNINMSTIDNWLGRGDVVYRDMRMMSDPAKFGELPGGDALLSRTIKGFGIVPFPFWLPCLRCP